MSRVFLRSFCAVLAGFVAATTVATAPAQAGIGAVTASTSTLVPPALTDAVTVDVTDAMHELHLGPEQDYVLRMPGTAITRAVKINGGRNVVLVGGRITIDWQGDDATPARRRGLMLTGQTGTVHIEGLLIDGDDLGEGIQIAAPAATVQIENVHIAGVHARDQVAFSDNTSDLVQPWGGVAALRIDGLSGSTDYRALMLKGDSGPIGSVSLRRIDVVGGPTSRHLMAKNGTFSLGVQDVWLQQAPDRTWDASVWPQLPDPTWSAVQQGVPPGGSFAPADTVGIGYVPAEETPVGGGAGDIDGSGAGATPPTTLRWAPPQLTNPSLVLASASNRIVKLAAGRDYVVQLPDTPLTGGGGLKIQGGRNVVLRGGEISIGWQGDRPSIDSRRGLMIAGQTGTVHIEGLLLSGSDLSEGIQIAAPEAVVQIQNVRIEKIQARDKVGFTDNHPDLIQPWGGFEELRVDRLTGATDYQGIFLKSEGPALGRADIRNVNIHGAPTARYLLWNDQDTKAAVSATNVYAVPGLTRSWNTTVSPRQPDPTWALARQGTPPGGDFVPRSHVGVGYTSPAPAIDIAGSAVFGDVSAGAYYDVPVGWLVSRHITGGVDGNRYQPSGTVTRAQMAAFLWRLAGKPAAPGAGFADVPADAYYAPAAAWLRQTGITVGVGGNRYDPRSTVTRAQMASFLHRFAGSPSPTATTRFADVPAGAYYDGATRWAAQHGVTSGTSGNRFAPGSGVTRAQMAAFLHRLATTPTALAPTAQPIVS